MFFCKRSYSESVKCMREFRMGRDHATEKERNKFLIPLVADNVNRSDLNDDLKLHLDNNFHIDCMDLVMFNTYCR